MDKNEELNKIEAEIKTLTEPLLKRKKEIRDQLESELIDRYKKEFENIKGKLFYGDGTTWGGYTNLEFQSSLFLIKPISCDVFGPYNSCNVFQIFIGLVKNKIVTIQIKHETSRVDNFETHYKPLTSEKFNEIRKMVDNELDSTFNIFKI